MADFQRMMMMIVGEEVQVFLQQPHSSTMYKVSIPQPKDQPSQLNELKRASLKKQKKMKKSGGGGWRAQTKTRDS